MNPEINPRPAVLRSAQAFVKAREGPSPPSKMNKLAGSQAGKSTRFAFCATTPSKNQLDLSALAIRPTPTKGLAAKMKLALSAALAVATFTGPSHAQDAIDQEQADAFNVRTLPPGDKAYACFVRRYDADHLARHPKRKVGMMRLLVSAEAPKARRFSAIHSGLV